MFFLRQASKVFQAHGHARSKPTKTFELTIFSRMEELKDVEHFIEQVVKECGFDNEQAYWFELTVMESMINAIQHGNQLDASKRVQLRIRFSGDSVDIEVDDQGGGFILDKCVEKTCEQNLFKASGRGIPIICSIMDDVSVSQREDGGSRLKMTKRLTPAAT